MKLNFWMFSLFCSFFFASSVAFAQQMITLEEQSLSSRAVQKIERAKILEENSQEQLFLLVIQGSLFVQEGDNSQRLMKGDWVELKSSSIEVIGVEKQSKFKLFKIVRN
jgi:hypothetical protein